MCVHLLTTSAMSSSSTSSFSMRCVPCSSAARFGFANPLLELGQRAVLELRGFRVVAGALRALDLAARAVRVLPSAAGLLDRVLFLLPVGLQACALLP